MSRPASVHFEDLAEWYLGGVEVGDLDSRIKYSIGDEPESFADCGGVCGQSQGVRKLASDLELVRDQLLFGHRVIARVSHSPELVR
jgi:hypothetical protein